MSINKSDQMKRLLSNLPWILVHPSDDALLHRTNWITQLSKVYDYLIKVYPWCSLQYYLKKYVVKLHNLTDGEPAKEAGIIDLWMKHFQKCSDRERFFMTKLFYESGFLTDDVVRKLMRYAAKTSYPDRRYCTAMDISMQTFRWAKGFYPEFYNDRRALLKQIALEQCKRPKRKPASKDKKRLCIVTFMLAPDFFNSVQRVASMIAGNLSEHYDEILVVSLETFYVSRQNTSDCYYCHKKLHSERYREEIKKLFPENVSVYIAPDEPFARRNQKSLNEIYRFNPDAIIDISDEMSALSYYYSQDFPVYYIPMRGSASSSFSTHFAGCVWKYELYNERFHSIEPEKIVSWIFPEYVPERKKAFTKGDLGVPDDSFVILSIGKNSTTYSEHFSDLFCKLLKKNPKMIWMLVGEGASDFVRSHYGALIESRQIIEWGFEKNLIDLCSACDVHIRPDMTGGSGATAIACQNGLPVVMTDFACDPMRWLGRDFSKLHTDEDMIAEIERLYHDKDYYQEQRQRVLKLVSIATDEHYWWNLLYQILQGKTEKEDAET